METSLADEETVLHRRPTVLSFCLLLLLLLLLRHFSRLTKYCPEKQHQYAPYFCEEIFSI